MQQDKKLKYTPFIRTIYKELFKDSIAKFPVQSTSLDEIMFSIGDVVLCDATNLDVDEQYKDDKNQVYAFVLDLVKVNEASSVDNSYGLICFLFSFDKETMYPIKRNKTVLEGVLHEKMFLITVDRALCTICSIHVPPKERPNNFTSKYISSNFDDVLPLDFKTGIIIYSYAKTEIDGKIKTYEAVDKIRYAYWCNIFFNGRQFDVNTEFWVEVKKIIFDAYLDPSKLDDRRCRKTRNTKFLCDAEWKFLMQYLQNTWPRPISRIHAADIAALPGLNSKFSAEAMYNVTEKAYSLFQLLRENYSASLLYNVLHGSLDNIVNQSKQVINDNGNETEDSKSPVDDMEDADEFGNLKDFIVKDDSDSEISTGEESKEKSESSESSIVSEDEDDCSDDTDVSSLSGSSDEIEILEDEGKTFYSGESEDEIIDGNAEDEANFEDETVVKYKKRKTENLLEVEPIPMLPLMKDPLLGSSSKLYADITGSPRICEIENFDLDSLEW